MAQKHIGSGSETLVKSRRRKRALPELKVLTTVGAEADQPAPQQMTALQQVALHALAPIQHMHSKQKEYFFAR
jgi:hypothetical protein